MPLSSPRILPNPVPRQIVDRGRSGTTCADTEFHVASGIVIDHACSAHYGQRGIFHTFPVREESRRFCAVIGVATIAPLRRRGILPRRDVTLLHLPHEYASADLIPVPPPPSHLCTTSAHRCVSVTYTRNQTESEPVLLVPSRADNKLRGDSPSLN